MEECKMSMVAMKVYYVDGSDVKQTEVIAPSKRAVTKMFELEEKEILKQTNVTAEYEFTLEDIKNVEGLTEKQRKMLEYILLDAGVAKYHEDEEDGNEEDNN